MTGRFVKSGGAAVRLDGTELMGFDSVDGDWLWDAGTLRYVGISFWNPNTIVGVTGSSGGLQMLGDTPTLVVEAGAADKKFVAEYSSVSGSRIMIFPRWVDNSNFVAWNPFVSTGNGRLRVRSGGSNTDETATSLHSDASQIGVEVIGNTINLYANGSLVATRSTAAHASTTKAAVGSQNTTNGIVITRLKGGTVALP